MDEPLVQIEVMVNIDSMRRGQVGEVELSPRIQALVDRGYLKILGHVAVPVVKALPVAPELSEASAPPETPGRRSRPSRAKRVATATLPEAPPVNEGGSDGDSSGDTDLE